MPRNGILPIVAQMPRFDVLYYPTEISSIIVETSRLIRHLSGGRISWGHTWSIKCSRFRSVRCALFSSLVRFAPIPWVMTITKVVSGISMSGFVVRSGSKKRFTADLLLTRTFHRIFRRFRINLADDFRLVVKRIHLCLHKLSLNFDDVLEILGLAEFLNKCKSSSKVLVRIPQKYSI